jgi:hypothetical protein
MATTKQVFEYVFRIESPMLCRGTAIHYKAVYHATNNDAKAYRFTLEQELTKYLFDSAKVLMIINNYGKVIYVDSTLKDSIKSTA